MHSMRIYLYIFVKILNVKKSAINKIQSNIIIKI